MKIQAKDHSVTSLSAVVFCCYRQDVLQILRQSTFQYNCFTGNGMLKLQLGTVQCLSCNMCAVSIIEAVT